MIRSKSDFLLFYLICALTLFISCQEDPTVEPIRVPLSGRLHLVLNEGLAGMQNASVTAIAEVTGEIAQNYFYPQWLSPLGDVANDILQDSTRVFVVLSNSRQIHWYSLTTLKLINKIDIDPQFKEPRHIEKENDSTFIVSTFSGKFLRLRTGATPSVTPFGDGCYPEEFVIVNNVMWYVNSGRGDLNQNLANASTLGRIDLRTNAVRYFPTEVKNPVSIRYSFATQRLYILCLNLPSETANPAKNGAIIEFNPANNLFYSVKNMRCHKMSLSGDARTVYVSDLDSKQIVTLDLFDGLRTSVKFTNPDTNKIWSNISVNPKTDAIWLTTMDDYQKKGEVEIWKNDAGLWSKRESYPCGFVPSKVCFIQ